MKVLFLQENGISESIGLCSLSAFLKQHNHDCDLILASHSDDIIKDINDYKPDIIGFTCFTGMEHFTYEMIRTIKKQVDIPIIMGGPHPTFYPECLDHISEIDFICRGEGEYPLIELLDALTNEGGDPTKINGICGRWKGKTFQNPIAPLIEDINALPMPDRDLYYGKYKFLRELPFKRFLAGYGCPYDCSFCNEPWLRKELHQVYNTNRSAFMRRKTVDNLLEEIKYMRDHYRLKRVHFSDDLFCTNLAWLKEFADKYTAEIDLPFSCNMRLDCTSEKMVRILKKANCYAVQVGIETGNEQLRDMVIKKDVSNQQIYDGVKILKKYGIKLLAANILGLPGETLEQALETVEMNIKIKANFIRINSLMPFPKTEIANYAIRNGYLNKDYSLKDLNTSSSIHYHCKTPHENEFQNIQCLFFYMVKLPFLFNFFKRVIKLKHNAFIRWLGIVISFQDTFYFRADPVSIIRFAYNTLFKGEGERGLHWIPALSYKKAENT